MRGLRLLCSALMGRRRLQLYLPLVRPKFNPVLGLLHLFLSWGLNSGGAWGTHPHRAPPGGLSPPPQGPQEPLDMRGHVTLTGKADSRNWLAVGVGGGSSQVSGSSAAKLGPEFGLQIPWICLSCGSTCGGALVALSGPELNTREHASVTEDKQLQEQVWRM